MKKKLALIILFGILGVGVYGQTIKSLGYNTTNGQVVYSGTNTLTFLKNIQIKGSDTTNIPTLFWQTSDGVGDGSMLAFSRRHATNLWFGINQTNWSQGAWGQNIQPTADGNDFTRKNTNFGSVALVLENEYNSEQNTNNPARTVAEMYFDVTDISGQRTRPLMFVGSQTNSALGWGYSIYPLTIGVTNLGWNAASALKVEFNNAGAGGTAVIANMATNGGSYAELQFVNSANSTIFYAKQNKFEIYGNHSPSYHILQAVTNGVIIGGAFSSSAAQRVQLGGNTRIDGAISFNATTNADITRTNLGLGWSALTNTNASNFRSAIGLGPTNNVTFADITASGVVAGLTYGSAFIAQDTNIYPIYTNTVISVSGFDGLQFHNPIGETNLANILATKTRTNLGLGGGITTNRTFVSYNGTNYTTNSVTISNGIITGWTQ